MKVAAAEEDEAPLVAAVNDQAGKTKAKRRTRKRETKGSEGEVSMAEADEVLAARAVNRTLRWREEVQPRVILHTRRKADGLMHLRRCSNRTDRAGK